MTERGFPVHKTTIWRWVQCYAPEIKKRASRHIKMTSRTHHIDETFIKVKGRTKYLYRAVDYYGNTIDFLVTSRKDKTSDERFIKSMLKKHHSQIPGKIVTDKNPAYRPSVISLKASGDLPKYTRHVKSKRKNDYLEQVHYNKAS